MPMDLAESNFPALRGFKNVLRRTRVCDIGGARCLQNEDKPNKKYAYKLKMVFCQ